MRIDVAADLICQKLIAGGVRATVDSRDLNPPAVWLELSVAEYNKMGPAHKWVGRWLIWVVVGDSGSGQAWKALGDWSDRVRAIFPTITNGTPAQLVVPGGGDPLPAMQWSVTLTATDDPAPDAPLTAATLEKEDSRQ